MKSFTTYASIIFTFILVSNYLSGMEKFISYEKEINRRNKTGIQKLWTKLGKQGYKWNNKIKYREIDIDLEKHNNRYVSVNVTNLSVINVDAFCYLVNPYKFLKVSICSIGKECKSIRLGSNSSAKINLSISRNAISSTRKSIILFCLDKNSRRIIDFVVLKIKFEKMKFDIKITKEVDYSNFLVKEIEINNKGDNINNFSIKYLSNNINVFFIPQLKNYNFLSGSSVRILIFPLLKNDNLSGSGTILFESGKHKVEKVINFHNDEEKQYEQYSFSGLIKIDQFINSQIIDKKVVSNYLLPPLYFKKVNSSRIKFWKLNNLVKTKYSFDSNSNGKKDLYKLIFDNQAVVIGYDFDENNKIDKIVVDKDWDGEYDLCFYRHKKYWYETNLIDAFIVNKYLNINNINCFHPDEISIFINNKEIVNIMKNNISSQVVSKIYHENMFTNENELNKIKVKTIYNDKDDSDKIIICSSLYLKIVDIAIPIIKKKNNRYKKHFENEVKMIQNKLFNNTDYLMFTHYTDNKRSLNNDEMGIMNLRDKNIDASILLEIYNKNTSNDLEKRDLIIKNNIAPDGIKFIKDVFENSKCLYALYKPLDSTLPIIVMNSVNCINKNTVKNIFKDLENIYSKLIKYEYISKMIERINISMNNYIRHAVEIKKIKNRLIFIKRNKDYQDNRTIYFNIFDIQDSTWYTNISINLNNNKISNQTLDTKKLNIINDETIQFFYVEEKDNIRRLILYSLDNQFKKSKIEYISDYSDEISTNIYVESNNTDIYFVPKTWTSIIFCYRKLSKKLEKIGGVPKYKRLYHVVFCNNKLYLLHDDSKTKTKSQNQKILTKYDIIKNRFERIVMNIDKYEVKYIFSYGNQIIFICLSKINKHVKIIYYNVESEETLYMQHQNISISEKYYPVRVLDKIYFINTRYSLFDSNILEKQMYYDLNLKEFNK